MSKKWILFPACAGALVLVTCLILSLMDHPTLLRYEQTDISFETENGRITRITIEGHFPYGVVYGRPDEAGENKVDETHAEVYVMEADFSLFMKSSMNLELKSEAPSACTFVFQFADRNLVITDGKVVEGL